MNFAGLDNPADDSIKEIHVDQYSKSWRILIRLINLDCPQFLYFYIDGLNEHRQQRF